MSGIRVALLQALKGRFKARKSTLKMAAVMPALAQYDRFSQLATRLRLHIQQTLKTEQDFVVTPVISQLMILYVRRAGALMNILRHKIVMQAAAGTARTPIAAQPALNGIFSLI